MKIYNFSKIKQVLMLLVLLTISGCASSNFDLRIQADKLTNSGKPFYVVVKEDSMSNYINTSLLNAYQDYLSDSDSFLVYPSNDEQSISIAKSKDNGIAVYFLFQKNPKINAWKYYINSDEQKDTLVKITNNNVIEVL